MVGATWKISGRGLKFLRKIWWGLKSTVDFSQTQDQNSQKCNYHLIFMRKKTMAILKYGLI